jgi:hypothetical protein
VYFLFNVYIVFLKDLLMLLFEVGCIISGAAVKGPCGACGACGRCPLPTAEKNDTTLNKHKKYK